MMPFIHQKVLFPKKKLRRPLYEEMLLFIVLFNLQKLSSDLIQFIDQDQAYIYSSWNEQQIKDTFLWFTIFFLDWLSMFRPKFDKSIHEKQTILIMDDHKSRENPISIKMIEQNKVIFSSFRQALLTSSNSLMLEQHLQ